MTGNFSQESEVVACQMQQAGEVVVAELQTTDADDGDVAFDRV